MAQLLGRTLILLLVIIIYGNNYFLLRRRARARVVKRARQPTFTYRTPNLKFEA